MIRPLNRIILLELFAVLCLLAPQEAPAHTNLPPDFVLQTNSAGKYRASIIYTQGCQATTMEYSTKTGARDAAWKAYDVWNTATSRWETVK